jgi:hypothetical protein
MLFVTDLHDDAARALLNEPAIWTGPIGPAAMIYTQDMAENNPTRRSLKPIKTPVSTQGGSWQSQHVSRFHHIVHSRYINIHQIQPNPCSMNVYVLQLSHIPGETDGAVIMQIHDIIYLCVVFIPL